MKARAAEWLAQWSGGPLPTAKMILFATIFITCNLWLAVWSANIVTTWAQTMIFRADTAQSATDSAHRWAVSRKEWATRIDLLSNRVAKVETQCARR